MIPSGNISVRLASEIRMNTVVHLKIARCRIRVSILLYLINVLLHTSAAFAFLIKEYSILFWVTLLSQTTSWCYSAILYMYDQKPWMCILSLVGISPLIEAVRGLNSLDEPARLVELQIISIPLSLLPLMFMYNTVIIFQGFSGFCSNLALSQSFVSSSSVFPIDLLCLCFLCSFSCSLTASTTLLKHVIVYIQHLHPHRPIIKLLQPMTVAYLCAILVYHILDLQLRIITLSLISQPIFFPMSFITVFITQTIVLCVCITFNGTFFCNLLTGMATILVGALPLLLADQDRVYGSRRQQRLCRLLLLLRTCEYSILLFCDIWYPYDPLATPWKNSVISAGYLCFVGLLLLAVLYFLIIFLKTKVERPSSPPLRENFIMDNTSSSSSSSSERSSTFSVGGGGGGVRRDLGTDEAREGEERGGGGGGGGRGGGRGGGEERGGGRGGGERGGGEGEGGEEGGGGGGEERGGGGGGGEERGGGGEERGGGRGGGEERGGGEGGGGGGGGEGGEERGGSCRRMMSITNIAREEEKKCWVENRSEEGRESRGDYDSYFYFNGSRRIEGEGGEIEEKEVVMEGIKNLRNTSDKREEEEDEEKENEEDDERKKIRKGIFFNSSCSGGSDRINSSSCICSIRNTIYYDECSSRSSSSIRTSSSSGRSSNSRSSTRSTSSSRSSNSRSSNSRSSNSRSSIKTSSSSSGRSSNSRSSSSRSSSGRSSNSSSSRSSNSRSSNSRSSIRTSSSSGRSSNSSSSRSSNSRSSIRTSSSSGRSSNSSSSENMKNSDNFVEMNDSRSLFSVMNFSLFFMNSMNLSLSLETMKLMRISETRRNRCNSNPNQQNEKKNEKEKPHPLHFLISLYPFFPFNSSIFVTNLLR